MPQTASRGPGRPPAAKAAETKERIVRAARDVFSELGYDAATFQAIAMRADLTRPAINHYFASKHVLYREVLEQTNTSVLARGIEEANGESTMVARLTAFVRAALQPDEPDRSAAAFLVTSVLESQRHPDLQFAGHDALANVRSFLQSVVADAVSTGELAADLDANALVEALVAMVWGMGFYAGYVRGAHDPAVVIDQFRHLVTGTLWELRA
ncbi:TetR/AcrR family transcriptional regulator [Mycobacterium sp. MYCO198283]|uniref:TetR/AcrR family transcriptional regulator n=1 Tax=Mycobacterium sp. MYCO198283 TaxID=2883505 RepID=UPI001E41E20D|nr:TetR/AcrR family transcriptional regulator [Mycobacterium sp. MYCO198283]MCG5434490.1 TetR/AcrR family transcriptional regulator [Mycobacterium sp. MYCO198283]